MVALARVTADLAEARGPDVACSIEVPVAWFEAGATLQIQLPRLMTCARCEGGGCDACGRRGAFEQKAAGLASEVAVVLPRQAAESCAPVKLRLPALGAHAPEPAAEPSAAEHAAVEEATARESGGVAHSQARPEGEGAAEGQAAAAGEAEEQPPPGGEPSPGGELPPGANEPPPVIAGAKVGRLPPGHLLLTVIPRAPDPSWAPPSNVQALVLAPPQRFFPEWLRSLELLLFPERLAAALSAWWQARAPAALRALPPIWIGAVLAVVLTLLGFWLLTRSGSRSQ